MKFSRRQFAVAAAALSLLIAGAAIAHRKLPDAVADEYPEPPFNPVGKDFPRFIPLAEEPADWDTAALKAYWDERRSITKQLKEQGAFQRTTPEERKALDADGDERSIEAREMAEKLLAEHSDSAPALYVLAGALKNQGNLPQALFRIREMRRLLEARGRANPDDPDSREWYLRGLLRENFILTMMDRRAEELRTVELMEKVYGEQLPWLKFWPLIKLDRFDEGKAVLEEVARTDRWPERVMNDRIVFEAQQRRRTESYEVGKKCVADKHATAVIWSNFSECCQADFRLKEAEEALRKSMTLERNFVRTPYLPLALMCLSHSRVPEAWEALNRADSERKSRKARTLEQDRADMAAGIAAFMLVLGDSTEAERRAREAREQLSRHGSSTDTKEIAALRHGVLHWNALQARLQERRESGNAGWADLAADSEYKRLEIESWTTKRAVMKLLGDSKFLNECLRPYLPDSPCTETWLMGTFMQILPSGVASEALRQARASDAHPGAAAYFDAMEAELELGCDHPARALELARRALENLPAEEKLLRGRIAAVAAESARRDGRAEDCRAFWGQALSSFPAASRLLQFAIPVRIEDDGSALAVEFGKQLLRSPRFRADPAGLRVVLGRENEQLHFTLYRDHEKVHCTDSVAIDGPEDDVKTAAVKRFHERLMSPSFSLTPEQINRLGSAASGARASDAAAKLVEGARAEPDNKMKTK